MRITLFGFLKNIFKIKINLGVLLSHHTSLKTYCFFLHGLYEKANGDKFIYRLFFYYSQAICLIIY